MQGCKRRAPARMRTPPQRPASEPHAATSCRTRRTGAAGANACTATASRRSTGATAGTRWRAWSHLPCCPHARKRPSSPLMRKRPGVRRCCPRHGSRSRHRRGQPRPRVAPVACRQRQRQRVRVRPRTPSISVSGLLLLAVGERGWAWSVPPDAHRMASACKGWEVVVLVRVGVGCAGASSCGAPLPTSALETFASGSAYVHLSV